MNKNESSASSWSRSWSLFWFWHSIFANLVERLQEWHLQGVLWLSQLFLSISNPDLIFNITDIFIQLTLPHSYQICWRSSKLENHGKCRNFHFFRFRGSNCSICAIFYARLYATTLFERQKINTSDHHWRNYNNDLFSSSKDIWKYERVIFLKN